MSPNLGQKEDGRADTQRRRRILRLLIEAKTRNTRLPERILNLVVRRPGRRRLCRGRNKESES